MHYNLRRCNVNVKLCTVMQLHHVNGGRKAREMHVDCGHEVQK